MMHAHILANQNYIFQRLYGKELILFFIEADFQLQGPAAISVLLAVNDLEYYLWREKEIRPWLQNPL